MFTYPIETPCIIADFAKIQANILRMQELCNRHGCTLRPHIKTHKSTEIARMQVKVGAVGITCAKVSEAEVMAAGGLTDIFIAYPLVGTSKIDRAIMLSQKIQRLILTVDSLAGASILSQKAQKHGIDLEVRLEVDTGLRRTGVILQEAIDLAAAIHALPHLQLTGLFTFKSMIYQGNPTLNKRAEAAQEECSLLDQISQALLHRGIKLRDLSAGSTPTGPDCAATGLVNEVRPGTYVFYDQTCLLQGSCKPGDIAARIFATVVSVPSPDHAVIDGGSKTFPTDLALNQPPLHLHSYGYVVGREDLRLDRLSEEHGMLRTTDGGPTGLQIGDLLELIPTHICPAINLQNHIYIEEDGILRKLPVEARGMVV